MPSEVNEQVFLGCIETTTPNRHINTVSCKEKALLKVKLSASPQGKQADVICKIDSGAETNILPVCVYKQLYSGYHTLKKPTVKLSAYGGTNIPNLGSCEIFAQSHHQPNPESIHVEIVDANGPVIIGNTTAQKLNLLKLNWPITTKPIHNQVNPQGLQHPFPLTKEYLLEEYKDVFTGIGCFPGAPYHIELDHNIPPIQHPPRQVPVHLQAAYLSELKKLKEAGILCEIHDEYTPWVNSTVVIPKPNGTIRLCLDPRDLNKAVKRNPYYVRTIDDVIPKIAGSTHFSILDARNGYWQVPLDEESSRLCTFSTPWGKYRWTRLPFGLTVSGDVFQEKMDAIFGNLEGLSGIADDTFIHGESEVAHDYHIVNVLETARRNNVKFNPDKFQYKVKETSFFGLTWTPDGLVPDKEKIKAIVDMPTPTNLAELRSFMGMINYLNRFSPTLAQTSLPLRQLTKKDTPYVWQPEHEMALQQLKQIISEAPVLSFYDPEKDNLIQADASIKGLGCVLMQEGKPVHYASRSLTEAESRYSNIERELLAASWSLEKFNHYVYGKKVTIETDHKPLESIWKKSIPSASPRLQRLLLRMAKYDADVRYIQGKSNVVADALSRVSYMEAPTNSPETPLIEVDLITRTIPASPAKLEEIRQCTAEDPVLHHLKDVIQHGWPEYISECPPDLKEYWTFREDLSVENGLIVKGPRLVIPCKLRQPMLDIVHQGHMGTEKCLLRAKESMFWPGISKDIKELIAKCPTCLQFSKQQQKEPLHPHNIPSFPWQKVGCDLFDYKQSSYLLIADYYSKFPVVRKLSSTTSSSIINHLKSIFAEYGIPQTLVSDNGPQYSSQEFVLFCKQWAINHVTSSPTYPKSNGFIERMVQTVKSILQEIG